jgi:hypothetical protein
VHRRIVLSWQSIGCPIHLNVYIGCPIIVKYWTPNIVGDWMTEKKCNKIVEPRQFSCGSCQTDQSLRCVDYEPMKMVII